MKKGCLVLLVVAVVAGTGYYQWTTRPISHPAGVLTPEAPFQEDMPDRGRESIEFKGCTLSAVAKFGVLARVLGTSRYRFGREGDLAPVDLALGWGRMSDTAVLDKLRVRQSGRFYYWTSRQFPIPRREIEQSSANMHIIPATKAVAADLKRIRRGHIVWFRGYLVNVSSDSDGWRWRTSGTRDDTGEGACELVFVRELRVFETPPKN